MNIELEHAKKLGSILASDGWTVYSYEGYCKSCNVTYFYDHGYCSICGSKIESRDNTDYVDLFMLNALKEVFKNEDSAQ